MDSPNSSRPNLSERKFICPVDGKKLRRDVNPARFKCTACESIWHSHEDFTESFHALLVDYAPNKAPLPCPGCSEAMPVLQVERLEAFIWSCPSCAMFLMKPRELEIVRKRQSQLLIGEHYASLSDKGKRSFYRQLNHTKVAETWAPKEVRPYRGSVSYADPDDTTGIFRSMPAVRAEHRRYRHFLAPLLTTLCLLTITFFGHEVSTPALLADAGILSGTRLHAFLMHSGFASLAMTHILFDGIEDRMPRWLLLLVLSTLFVGFGLLSSFAAGPTIILGGSILALYSAFSSLLLFPKAHIYFLYIDSKLSLPSWALALMLTMAQAFQLSSQSLSNQLWTLAFTALLSIVSFGFVHGLGFNLQKPFKYNQAS